MLNTEQQDIAALEKQGWQALATDQATAQKYYEPLLTKEAAMLFPGGLLIKGKEKILASIGSQPWQAYEISETQLIHVAEEAKIIVYKVKAWREESDVYNALVSSTYVWREDSWKLILHQQTPV